MSENWVAETVGSTSTVILSGVDKHIVAGETPTDLCNYLDVYRNRRLTKGMGFAAGTATPKEIRRFSLQKGDVLITKDSETPDDIGIPSLVIDDLPDTICGYHLAILRPGNRLYPGFLLHYLQSDATRRHFLRTANGVTRFGLGARAIASLPISVPPIEEQIAITRILDAIDLSFDLAREEIRCAAELERAVLRDAFDNLPAQRQRLGAFTTDIRYGTSTASNARSWGNPVLRIPNVIGNRLRLNDLAYVKLRPAEVKRLEVQDGDLLIVRTNGNPNYVGRSVVFRPPDDRKWVYASYLIRVRITDQLLPEFVNVYLGLERGRRELLRRVTTSAGNHNINSSSIRLLSIPVPANKNDQERIVQLARKLRERVDLLQVKLAALVKLKNSLRKDLLTGKIQVKNEIGVAAL